MHSAKIITSILIILAVIIGFSVYSLKILSSASERLDSHIAQIENSIHSKNWNEAARELANFKNTWIRTSRTWAMLVDHVEIDNIDNTFIRLSTFIEIKNQPLALEEAAVLKQYITHIPEKEQLHFKNVL